MKRLLKTTFAYSAIILGAAGDAFGGDFPAVNFPMSPNGYVDFTMPSGNIECIYTPAGGSKVYTTQDGDAEISCDRNEPEYLRFSLSAHGKAEIIKNVEDPSCCGNENPLPYGSSFRAGPFECDSTASGLTCENDKGHGFHISRAKISAY